MQNVNRSLAKTGKKLQSLGSALSVGVTLPLTALGVASLKAFDTQAKAIAQVEAGLKSTGNQVGKTSEELQQLASDLQNNSLFGDEEILKNATSQLLTFTNIAGEQFERTQLAALDLATRLDGDLKSASIQLGKALNDPVANLSALSRSGIQFSEEQKKTINTLAQTNRLADAQTLILDELAKQYGGSAEAAAKAGTGPLKQLSNILGDITEDFGAIIAEGIAPFVAYIKEIALKFKDLSPTTKKFIVVLGGIAAAIGPLLALAGTILPAIGTGFALLTGPIGLVVAALSAIAVVVVKYWQPIKQYLVEIANYFIDLYNESTIVRIGIEAVGLSFKNLYATGVFVFDALSSVVKLFVDAVKTGFSGLGKVVKGALTFDYELIKEGLSDAFTGAQKSISTFVANIKGDFDKLNTTVGENISEAIDNVTKRKKIAFVKENIDAKAVEDTVAQSVQNGLIAGASGSGNGRAQVNTVEGITPGVNIEFISPLDGIVAKLPEQREAVDEELIAFQSSLIDFQEQSGQIIESAAEGFAVGFGNLIAGIAKGANPIQGLVSLILTTIGDMLQQLGQAAISIGITMTGIKKAFASPVAAIAAGVAAIALGAIIKSFIPKDFAGAFANGGVVGGTSFTGDKLFAAVNSGEMILNKKQQANLSGMLAGTNSTNINLGGGFVVSGEDLKLILKRQDAKDSRRT
ncbi:phage tail length tape measure family protein [Mesoflavibacter profundi]|uniref:phage tail length tape measure family protein n=1 Tax=Mesoflavibacter profundi TaxID=2708110 RepID=UPI0035171740